MRVCLWSCEGYIMAANKETLELLHSLVAQSLVSRVESGEASSADIANALRMLRENDITIIEDDNDHLALLREKLSKKKKVHEPDLTFEGKNKDELFN